MDKNVENNTIHIHKEHNFDRTKLMILMIPCLVFLVILAVFIALSSYQNPLAFTSENQILGVED